MHIKELKDGMDTNVNLLNTKCAHYEHNTKNLESYISSIAYEKDTLLQRIDELQSQFELQLAEEQYKTSNKYSPNKSHLALVLKEKIKELTEENIILRGKLSQIYFR